MEDPEQFAELLGDGLLAGVLLRAAALLAGVAVVDVAALVDLARHRAAIRVPGACPLVEASPK